MNKLVAKIELEVKSTKPFNEFDRGYAEKFFLVESSAMIDALALEHGFEATETAVSIDLEIVDLDNAPGASV